MVYVTYLKHKIENCVLNKQNKYKTCSDAHVTHIKLVM